MLAGPAHIYFETREGLTATRHGFASQEYEMELIESFLVPKAAGTAFVVKAGQVLRLTQPEGPAGD